MKSPQFSLHAQMEEGHWWFRGRRTIALELIRHVLPASQGEIVVDIGCGTGGNIAALGQDYSCIGMDSSLQALELAKDRFPKTQFIHGSSLSDLGQMRKEVSLFLMMDVLEHVRDDFLLLSEALGAAKPGAYFLLTVPADMALWSEHDVSFGHYRRYDMERLKRLWAGLPVSVPLVSYYNSRLYPIIRFIRTFNRLRGSTNGMAGTDFRMPSPPVNRMLESIFSSEAKVLVDTLLGRRRQGFSYGVSLMALLQREPGEISPQTKPSDVPPDPHHPQEQHG